MKRALSRKNLWDRTPQWIRFGLSVVMGTIPPALLLGRRFRETLRFIDEAQWWPAERSRVYQLDQLRRTCTLAFEKTAYYRRTFEAAGFDPRNLRSLEDLRALPTIDKETLRAHLDEMCARSPDAPDVDYVSTGGSSGEPLRFYISADRSAIEYAYLVASWRRIGYRLEMAQAVFRGQIVAKNRNGLRHMYDPILRRHYYSNFHMTDANIGRYLEHVATIGPCFLHVYPSSGDSLARFVERNGVPAPSNIRGILAGSENVYESDRRRAEAVFGVRYLSWYGHSEKLVLAAECEQSSVCHVFPTYGYCELIDSDGRPVTERGQVGEIVGTGFINRVVPFIRYRTGDYAEYAGDRCPDCGREQMLLARIEGRWPQGCLVSRDGASISMTALNLHDDTLENVRGYQFHQAVPGEAVLRVVPSRTLNNGERQQILGRLGDRLQGQVRLTLEIRTELQQTPRGKLLRVVQEIPGAARDGETG